MPEYTLLDDAIDAAQQLTKALTTANQSPTKNALSTQHRDASKQLATIFQSNTTSLQQSPKVPTMQSHPIPTTLQSLRVSTLDTHPMPTHLQPPRVAVTDMPTTTSHPASIP